MTNPYAPPRAAVQDVLDPAAGVALADLGTRFGANLLDGLIVAGAVYLPIIVGAMIGNAGTGTNEPGSEAAVGVGVMIAVVGFVVWLGFTIKFMAANGQSIGKKATGIKVVRRDGSPAAVSRVILLRNVVNMALSLIPLYGLVDALFIFGAARRCVHDYIADTIVIKA
jgi:uncharacterized RDD family membrane protein YckC